MAKYEDRPYQKETVDLWWEDLHKKDCKPIIALPTGSGKSVVVGRLLQRYFKKYPHNTVLLLSHTKYILQQDYEAVTSFVPHIPTSFYSNGLGEKVVSQLTIGGIQSVINAKDKFEWTNLIIIDEVHAVNHKQTGNYRKLLDNVHGKVTGMSATVFRTGHGYIHKGKTALFNKLTIDLTQGDKFYKLVKAGYLSDLVSVSPVIQLDSSTIAKTADDYNLKALADAHDRPVLTNRILNNAIKNYTAKYKKWLVFAIDIKHANNITKQLNNKGVSAKVLHTKMNEDDEKVIQEFRDGKFTALVSVGKVTTGFDVADIDVILMLRPTLSPVLHVQMLGRGTRVAPGKKHCLVLDYSGNLQSLGPINDIRIPVKGAKKTSTEPAMKVCPKCRTLCWPSVRICPSCEHKFIFKTKLLTSASTAAAIVKTTEPKLKWYKVTSVDYYIRPGINGKPDIMFINYTCGVRVFKQMLCLNHQGFARYKAIHMLKSRGYNGPFDMDTVYQNRNLLKKPKHILVDSSGKYTNIKSVKL